MREHEIVWLGADGPAGEDAAVASVRGSGPVAEAAAPPAVGAADAASSEGGSAPPAVGAADGASSEGGPAADLDTPAALLIAGKKLFSRYGYEGASVRAITSEAGANLGAITYHFGSKKTLYNRVVEACVAPLAGRVEAALAQPAPLLDRLELVVRAYFDHFGENPELPHLMLQELVAGSGPPEAAGPTMRRIFALLQEEVRRGQEAGEIRAGDPVLLVMSLISQPIFPMLAREPVRVLAGIDVRDGATRERVATHVAAVVRAGLERKPEDGR